MRICDIIEYGSQDDIYDFPIKNHNLNDKKVIVYINNELGDYGENLRVKEILEKEEGCYKSSRFFDGQDAKDEGYDCWVAFLPLKDYKKGLGKYTNYKVKLEKRDD